MQAARISGLSIDKSRVDTLKRLAIEQANGVSAAEPGGLDGGDPEVSDLAAPAPDETADGGFVSESALASLAPPDGDEHEPLENSAPF